MNEINGSPLIWYYLVQTFVTLIRHIHANYSICLNFKSSGHFNFDIHSHITPSTIVDLAKPCLVFVGILHIRCIHVSGLMDITIGISTDYESYNGFIEYIVNTTGLQHGQEVSIIFSIKNYRDSNNFGTSP